MVRKYLTYAIYSFEMVWFLSHLRTRIHSWRSEVHYWAAHWIGPLCDGTSCGLVRWLKNRIFFLCVLKRSEIYFLSRIWDCLFGLAVKPCGGREASWWIRGEQFIAFEWAVYGRSEVHGSARWPRHCHSWKEGRVCPPVHMLKHAVTLMLAYHFTFWKT